MSALQIQSAIGLLALALLAWVLGGCRRGVPWRVILVGMALQIMLAAALLHIPPLRAAFALLGRAVDALAAATRQGTSLVFGYLGGGPLPFAEPFPGAGFILFFQGLPLVLVVGALSALLYHWRILPVVVAGMAKLLTRTLGISGATGFSVAANVFVGMVEAPLLIRPWLMRLSISEMFVVMTAGLATISGNMLVVYALMIAPVVPDAAGQLLVASLVSAPAAIVVALLIMPPREGEVPEAVESAAAPRLYDSAMEAVVRGTMDGLQLLFGIMAMLIVFVALVALVNMMLEPVTGLTLQVVAAWFFWPVAFAMGVPLEHVATVAQSLAVKVVVNEFVSYLQLATSGGQGLDGRSRLILTYALCGFTSFGSVGIMLGGMTAMVPERRADIVRLGLPALVAAFIACCMTGAVVGMLVAP
jgi:CNT family concentrative nucleoside transporter